MARKQVRSWLGTIRARTPLVLPGQRIGLMGGSFNPPHEGHVCAAETALKRLRLDCVWWIVSPGNPLKQNEGLPRLDERIAACRRLVRNPRIEVTGFEAALEGPFTARTLAFLHARHPAARFVWLMGADNLAQLHLWRDWRNIAAETPIAVIDRPGWRLKGLASPAGHVLARHRLPEARAPLLASAHAPAMTLLTTRLSPTSSTALRQRSKSGPKSGR